MKTPGTTTAANDTIVVSPATVRSHTHTTERTYRYRARPEGQGVVIVHCTIAAEASPGSFFIRRATALVDHATKRTYPLLHTAGIRHEMPDVVKVAGRPLHFTLYFAGLPRSCTHFDMVERTTDAFAFTVRNMERNARDVYRVTFHEPKPDQPTNQALDHDQRSRSQHPGADQR